MTSTRWLDFAKPSVLASVPVLSVAYCVIIGWVAEVGYIPADTKHKSQAQPTVPPTYMQARPSVLVSRNPIPKDVGY